MKRIKHAIVVFIFFAFPVWLTAQPPHPNNGGGTPGYGNTTVGGSGCLGGSIDNGVGFLIAFGLAYGACKVYRLRNQLNAEGAEDQVMKRSEAIPSAKSFPSSVK